MVEKKNGKEEDPNSPFDTATLAEIFIKQGHLGKGLKIYQKLSRFEPDNSLYKNKIAELTDRIQQEGAVTNPGQRVAGSSSGEIETSEPETLSEKECVKKENQMNSGARERVLETLNKWLTAVRKRKKHVQ
jgi:hypothetical protein